LSRRWRSHLRQPSIGNADETFATSVMEKTSTGSPKISLFDGTAWLDSIEVSVRERIRGFIETMLEAELTTALGREQYRRCGEGTNGYRHGSRHRQILGSLGPLEITVPRGRIPKPEGGTAEWRSAALPRYARMTKRAEALVAATYLAGTNTRRVTRALGAFFKGAVGKDVVSRTWRKVKADWEGWNRRSLADDDIVRLILDGTVVKVRLDRRATNISLLVVLDDLIARGLRTPDLLLIDGGAGLERALASLWPNVPTQRCTVHKHRNLLAHAPEALQEEITADYNDMTYAETSAEVRRRRRLFFAKWRLKCRGVADSL
jgi:transposase-like protein